MIELTCGRNVCWKASNFILESEASLRQLSDLSDNNWGAPASSEPYVPTSPFYCPGQCDMHAKTNFVHLSGYMSVFQIYGVPSACRIVIDVNQVLSTVDVYVRRSGSEHTRSVHNM